MRAPGAGSCAGKGASFLEERLWQEVARQKLQALGKNTGSGKGRPGHSPSPGTCWLGPGVPAPGEHTAPRGSLHWTGTHSAFARCRGSTETPLTPAEAEGGKRKEGAT